MDLLLQILLSFVVFIVVLLSVILWVILWGVRRITHPIYKLLFVLSALVVLVSPFIALRWSVMPSNVNAPLPASVGLILGDGYSLQRWRGSDGSSVWSSHSASPIVEVAMVDSSLMAELVLTDVSSYATRLLVVRTIDGQVVWSKAFAQVPAQSGCQSLASFYWQHQHRNEFLLATPGAVYICQGKTLYALRASDGAQMWGLPVAALVDTGFNLRAITAGEGFLVLASGKGDILALRVANGTLAWHSTITDASMLLLANQTLYVGRDGSSVSALRAQDGRMLWQSEPAGFFAQSLSATSSRVYLVASGNVKALAARSGAVLWQQALPSSSCPSTDINPVEAGPIVYVVAGCWLSALRASDGTFLWRYQPPNGFLFWQASDEERGTLLTPVVVQGVLFLPIAQYIPALAPRSVRPEDGMVALNAATGAVYWSRFDLERGAQLRFVMAEKA